MFKSLILKWKTRKKYTFSEVPTWLVFFLTIFCFLYIKFYENAFQAATHEY